MVGGSQASLGMIAGATRAAGPSPVRKVPAAAVGEGRPQASLRARDVSRSPPALQPGEGATEGPQREARLDKGGSPIPTFKELRAANERKPQESKSVYKARLMGLMQRAKKNS